MIIHKWVINYSMWFSKFVTRHFPYQSLLKCKQPMQSRVKIQIFLKYPLLLDVKLDQVQYAGYKNYHEVLVLKILKNLWIFNVPLQWRCKHEILYIFLFLNAENFHTKTEEI